MDVIEIVWTIVKWWLGLGILCSLAYGWVVGGIADRG